MDGRLWGRKRKGEARIIKVSGISIEFSMTRILVGQLSGSGCHTGDDVTHKTELNIDIRLYQLFVTCEAKISELIESLTFDCWCH